MKSLHKDERGVALILTILVIGLIAAMTLQFSRNMRAESHSAVNLKAGVRLGSIARSGVDYALAVLFEDALGTDFDSFHESWADSELLGSNSATLFEDGRLNLMIRDLSGRIQVNNLVNQDGGYNETQKGLLMRFLTSEQFGLDSEEASNIVDAIKDWIDHDNEVTRFGAERTYYEELESPYHCKNSALSFPQELLFVKGITGDLLNGTKESPGISAYLATHGEGKININTADPIVLSCLSDQIDQEMVEDMVEYRSDAKNNLKDRLWYKKVRGMGDVTIPEDLVTTSSAHFEIKSEGQRDNMSKTVMATIERKGGSLQILSWKVE